MSDIEKIEKTLEEIKSSFEGLSDSLDELKAEVIKAIFKISDAKLKALLIKDLTEDLVNTERVKIFEAMTRGVKGSQCRKTIEYKLDGGLEKNGELEKKEWSCNTTIDIRNAQGNDKLKWYKCYKWIRVKCEVLGKKKFQSNYVICMNQQDFDMKNTGNAHVLIDGKIQIWRNLIQFDSAENGGSIRPLPIEVEEKGKEIVEIKEEYKDVWDVFEGEQPYKFYHAPTNAYPVAAKTSTSKPWGFTKKQIGVEKIPVMDMAKDGYDPKELGDFFNRLILADIMAKDGCDPKKIGDYINKLILADIEEKTE